MVAPIVLLLLVAVHARAQAADLPAVLATAGPQVARYAQAEHLQSALVLLADPTVSWIEFRDTTTIGGKPVGGREARFNLPARRGFAWNILMCRRSVSCCRPA